MKMMRKHLFVCKEKNIPVCVFIFSPGFMEEDSNEVGLCCLDEEWTSPTSKRRFDMMKIL